MEEILLKFIVIGLGIGGLGLSIVFLVLVKVAWNQETRLRALEQDGVNGASS